MTETELLHEIIEKLDKLDKDILKNERLINAHPLLFIGLLVLFFVTMELWATAAQTTIHHFYDKDSLSYWEYIIIASIFLAVLVWVGNYNNIRLRQLSGSIN
jgi:multisubunit Na+/H+ antiporter MnhB subunit